jgi:hydroxymethylglutaryl-CoA lyase
VTELPVEVEIREVGPRDGLQNERPVPTDAKVALIDALSLTGVRRIEAASFVSPAAVPQMADAEEVWERMTRAEGITYDALVANRKGADRALAAGVDEIEVVVSASETHNRMNVRRAVEESLREAAEIVSLADGVPVLGIVSTSFGCPYEGEVPIDRVIEIGERMLEAGCRSVSFGDTTGMATPARARALVRAWQGPPPLLHFHNTRGAGLANVLAALEEGVSELDASVGGLGGCPYAPGATGNICTEDLVHMLEDMGVRTGIDLDRMIAAAWLAEKVVGRELPGQVMRAGPRTKTVPA